MGKLRHRKRWLLCSSAVLLLAACNQTANDEVSASQNVESSASSEEVISSESQTSSEGQEVIEGQESSVKPSDQADVSEVEDESNDEQDLTSVESYFPKTVGYAAEFEGTGNEYTSFSRTYDFIEDDYIQMRTNNGGTTKTDIVEVTEDAATVIYSQPETYAYEQINLEDVSMEEQTPYVLLSGPIELGHSWDSGRGTTREITGINVPMSTIHGLYDTIEVMEDTGDFINKEYYAADIGLVYTSSEATDPEAPYTVIQDLASLSTDGWEEMISLFYPIEQDSYERSIESTPMTTNDEMADVLTNFFQTAGPEPLMSEGMAIESIATYRDESNLETTLYVDFSNGITELANDEWGMQKLNAVMATLQTYYGTSKIIPTIDDQPMYIEGLVKLNKGASFDVPDSVIDEAQFAE